LFINGMYTEKIHIYNKKRKRKELTVNQKKNFMRKYPSGKKS